MEASKSPGVQVPCTGLGCGGFPGTCARFVLHKTPNPKSRKPSQAGPVDDGLVCEFVLQKPEESLILFPRVLSPDWTK